MIQQLLLKCIASIQAFAILRHNNDVIRARESLRGVQPQLGTWLDTRYLSLRYIRPDEMCHSLAWRKSFVTAKGDRSQATVQQLLPQAGGSGHIKKLPDSLLLSME